MKNRRKLAVALASILLLVICSNYVTIATVSSKVKAKTSTKTVKVVAQKIKKTIGKTIVKPAGGKKTKSQVRVNGTTKKSTVLDNKNTNIGIGKLVIKGDGVVAEKTFSLSQLKSMTKGIVNAEYFSRGKEPQKESNSFKGVNLYYLLSEVVGLNEGAKKIVVTAGDGYSIVLSMNEVKEKYMDETDPTKILYMILAFSQDGKDYEPSDGSSFRLVMGQQLGGEYNRQKWVRNVISIEVKGE